MTPGGSGGPFPRWLDRGAGFAWRLLAVVAAVAVLIWLVLRVKFVATGVVLGFAETALLWPVARWLRARGVPRVVAAVLSMLAFLAVFGAILWFVVLRVLDALPTLVASLTDGVQSLIDWAASSPLGGDSSAVQQLVAQAQGALGGIAAGLGSQLLSGLAAVADLATVLGIATFFAIFALTSGDSLWREFVALLPRGEQQPVDAGFRAALRTTGAWFYASTVTGAVDGALIGVGLLVLHVPLALAIGAVTFVFAYIPLVGATLAGVLAIGVAFASGGLVTAVWALVVVLLVQQVEGNILSPLLLSRAVNFPPLVVLVLTTTAAAGFGLIGLFLAVPVSGAVVAALGAYRRAQARGVDRRAGQDRRSSGGSAQVASGPGGG